MGFLLTLNMDTPFLFACWHYSICNLTIKYANLIESGYVLAFLVFSCYTITRYKTRKNQGLTRVSPISGVSQIPAVFDSRDIRQMDVQAPPHGSLFRGK